MSTPGPWKTRQGQSVCTHKGVSVAWCPTSWIGGQDFSYRVSEEEACANARLIAKAPAMHDVLRRVAAFWAGGDVPEDLDRDIRALLEE